MIKRKLFLDNDGVLADFDSYAYEVFGLPSRKAEEQLGTDRFWADLQSVPDFYYNLPLMTDAMELFDAVKHLEPIILTGSPRGDWAEPQKLRWRDKYFPGVPMIVCKSAEKLKHMEQPGDILIDDWPKYINLWEDAGGIFILHSDAKTSINELKRYGVL